MEYCFIGEKSDVQAFCYIAKVEQSLLHSQRVEQDKTVDRGKMVGSAADHYCPNIFPPAILPLLQKSIRWKPFEARIFPARNSSSVAINQMGTLCSKRNSRNCYLLKMTWSVRECDCCNSSAVRSPRLMENVLSRHHTQDELVKYEFDLLRTYCPHCRHKRNPPPAPTGDGG